MKKTLLFAAVAALFTIASCQKEVTPIHDQNGDLVFTAAIAGQEAKTTIDASNGKVSWVSGDEITIKDAAKTAVKYTVGSIDAQGKATFTKKAGEAGTLGDGPYTAVYGTDPATSQTYSATVPTLPMSAESTTTDLTFTVSCGLLKITITQEGESIKNISVSDNATTPNTYSLNCGNGVSIESGATFYLAVPAGTYISCQLTNGTDVVRGRTGFSIAVAANQIQPISSNFAPKYTSGKTDADYGIKVGSKWWAPVNCGYDDDHKYGLLYQWSRKYGQPFETTPAYITTQASSIADGNTDANKDKFYKDNQCWYSGNTTSDTWDQTNYNPCPTGWRVPTNDEFMALLGGSGKSPDSLQTDTRSGSATYSMTGLIFDYTSTKQPTAGVFFPAAGCRSGCGLYSGTVMDRDSKGGYWSSSPHASTAHQARMLNFVSGSANTSYSNRANGYSIRCIKE